MKNDRSMGRFANKSILFIWALTSSLFVSLVSVSAEALITFEEAGRPNVPQSEVRVLIPGPIATPISPKKGGTVNSPFTLEVDFQLFGGASIASIDIWYVKNPMASLTERVSKYLLPDQSKPNKLLFKGAEAPPGRHRIRIETKDTAGRRNTQDFEFDVSN
jgi:hypothetical protein